MWRAEKAILEKLKDTPQYIIDFVEIANADCLNILAIADIHLTPPNLAVSDGATYDPSSDTLEIDDDIIRHDISRTANDFTDILESHSQALRLGSQKWHAIVNCGDIFDARDAAEKIQAYAGTLERSDALVSRAYRIFYEQLAVHIFEDHLLQRFSLERPDIITVPGNHDVYRNGVLYNTGSDSHFGKHRPYYDFYAKHFDTEFKQTIKRPPDEPYFKLIGCSMPGEEVDHYVAFIGFDSNWVEYNFNGINDLGKVSDAQLRVFDKLLMPALTTLAQQTPLYIIAVLHHNLLPVQNTDIDGTTDKTAKPPRVGATTNAVNVIETLQKHRVSLVLHGHMHNNAIQEIAYHHFTPNGEAKGLTILACPSFDGGTDNRGYKGMVSVRLDLTAGLAHIEALSALPDQKGEPAPIQVTRPLLSASRIQAPELKLYKKVVELLKSTKPEPGGMYEELYSRFSQWVSKCMRVTGYVPVCDEDGKSLDFFIKPMRTETYMLLVILRDDGDGRPCILLNRHTPLRITQFANWDTLLLPAFRSVKELLTRLRDDMLRRRLEIALRPDRASLIADNNKILTRLIDDEARWETAIKFVAAKTFIKISPTEATPTEYNYSLVTLDLLASGDRQHQEDVQTLHRLLRKLPHISDDPSKGEFPIEALQNDGGGLRFDPKAEMSRATQIPPGAVWFPLDAGQGKPKPWKSCPSIVARNADIMTWVDEVLARCSALDEMTLGKSRSDDNVYHIVEAFPFRTQVTGEVQKPRSLVEGLNRVKHLAGFDLERESAYGPDASVAKIILKKSNPDSRLRQLIEVYEAKGNDVSDGSCGEKLGVLRPVQRFVLSDGLKRAEVINREILRKLQDPWGFARVRSPSSTIPVGVTPPILEQLAEKDWEGTEKEFVLCDGNHRVVQSVWMQDGGLLQGIAILGDPRQPFYARPFSRFEWGVTAENSLDAPPDLNSKYMVRRLTDEEFDALSDAAKSRLLGVPKRDWYRRWFRDLTTGFGYLGPQGGRRFVN